jgi:hypothetical protein
MPYVNPMMGMTTAVSPPMRASLSGLSPMPGPLTGSLGSRINPPAFYSPTTGASGVTSQTTPSAFVAAPPASSVAPVIPIVMNGTYPDRWGAASPPVGNFLGTSWGATDITNWLATYWVYVLIAVVVLGLAVWLLA